MEGVRQANRGWLLIKGRVVVVSKGGGYEALIKTYEWGCDERLHWYWKSNSAAGYHNQYKHTHTHTHTTTCVLTPFQASNMISFARTHVTHKQTYTYCWVSQLTPLQRISRLQRACFTLLSVKLICKTQFMLSGSLCNKPYNRLIILIN